MNETIWLIAEIMMRLGFREAARATAFGQLQLSDPRSALAAWRGLELKRRGFAKTEGE